MSDQPYDEWAAVAERFGAGVEQVRRDHLISHVLAALSSEVSTEDLVFIGGTALSRTYLADARLSEDIDLVALRPRAQVASQIELAVRRGLARTHGRPSWRPALTVTRGSEPAVLEVDETLGIQVQLVTGDGFLWPTEVRRIEQRYADAPPARLRTLTAAGFAAAKLATWMDRHAPRDLYDLWALAERGLIDGDALKVFVAQGPTGKATAGLGLRHPSRRSCVAARAEPPNPPPRHRGRGSRDRASGVALAARGTMTERMTGRRHRPMTMTMTMTS